MNREGQWAALYAASRSTIKKFRTGAAITDKRGNVLEIGWSHVGEQLTSTPWSTHAEHHAIKRYGLDPSGLIVYVATLSRCENVTTAAPCESCFNLLERRNIREVRFSLPGNRWSALKF